MSQSIKRSAEVAFEGQSSANARTSKRPKNKRRGQRRHSKTIEKLQNGTTHFVGDRASQEVVVPENLSTEVAEGIESKRSTAPNQEPDSTGKALKYEERDDDIDPAGNKTSQNALPPKEIPSEGGEDSVARQGEIEVDHIPSTTRKARHRKRRQSILIDTDAELGALTVHRAENTALAKKKRPKKSTPGGKVVLQTEHAHESGWALTKGIGGAFIAHDPILTQGDQYLILPTDHDIRIYAASTSLLVRSLHLGDRQNITSCTLSKNNPSTLFVATLEGMVCLFDWTDGHKICEWKVGGGLQQIIAVQTESGVKQVLTLQRDSDEMSTLSAVELDVKAKKAAKIKVLLKRERVDPTVQFFQESGVLIASAFSKVLIGYSPLFEISKTGEATFIWRELSVAGPITGLDARISSKGKSTSKRAPATDIVLGLKNGLILVFQDVLFKLIAKETGGLADDIPVRQLHWHRNAVNALKWSRDGNYVVSGGNETVLVIWQLDTNEKQFLPHLSTSILNLMISLTGSSYAVRLGDNSVMVLSTADLLPSSNISGLAVGQAKTSRLPCTLHPLLADRLLVAVPTNASSTMKSKGECATLLQTYDIAADMQVGRQALTRNFTTALNIGPDGRILQEPNVTNLQVSHDGRWLATVERWSPDHHDLDGMYLPDEEGRRQHLETCLRFWEYNAEDQSWELVTRVDEPHARDVVLDLKVHPTKIEFATVGADSKVCTWSPKARLRDGVSIKNQSGGQLYTWTRSLTVHCDEPVNQASSSVLAFAEDGSVAAVSWSQYSSSRRYVHLIDYQTGSVCLSIPDLTTSGEVCLAFADRYLLCLSQVLSVFDIVNANTVFTVNLASALQSADSGRYLATNKVDGTFAVGINQKGKQKSGIVAVFDVNNLSKGPIFQTTIDGRIAALTSSSLTPGYTLIDSYSRIRQVRGSGIANAVARSVRAEPKEVSRNLDTIFGLASSQDTANQSSGRLIMGAEDVTAPRTLEDVLNFQRSSEAPPVGELFDRIAGIFALPAVSA